jgi:hypothetical protein
MPIHHKHLLATFVSLDFTNTTYPLQPTKTDEAIERYHKKSFNMGDSESFLSMVILVLVVSLSEIASRAIISSRK